MVEVGAALDLHNLHQPPQPPPASHEEDQRGRHGGTRPDPGGGRRGAHPERPQEVPAAAAIRGVCRRHGGRGAAADQAPSHRPHAVRHPHARYQRRGRRHRIALMLCDIRMPGTSGVDLVPAALEAEPELAILMLTAVNDATSAALCMQRGAMDYLTKPIELADLGRAVQRALKRREMLLENRQLNQWLKEEVSTRTAELQRERMKLERLSIATLEALVNALEAKDPYMRGHSARVADLSATVAHELGIPEEDVELVRVAGRLHDIGKIGTRESVLNKQGALTPEEF